MATGSWAQSAREAVVLYESGKITLEDLLKVCDWGFGSTTDPMHFVDVLYGSLRRVEAAAYATRGQKNELVQRQADQAKVLPPHIHAMCDVVNQMEPPRDMLGNAGKAFLLDRLEWALGVIKTSLPSWGY